MRNIKRVILWGVPPSFCALVQQCGRAGRDFSVHAEAVLIAPANAFTKATMDADIGTAVYAATIAKEASNRNDEDETILVANGVTVAHGNELVSIEQYFHLPYQFQVDSSGLHLNPLESTGISKRVFSFCFSLVYSNIVQFIPVHSSPFQFITVHSSSLQSIPVYSSLVLLYN